VEKSLLIWEDIVTFWMALREGECKKGICGLMAEGDRRRR
jgi:hypothetical protein